MSEILFFINKTTINPDLNEAILYELHKLDGVTFTEVGDSTIVKMSATCLLNSLRHTPTLQQITEDQNPSYNRTPQKKLPNSPKIFSKLSLSFPSPIVFNHSAVINIAGEFIPDELLLVASLGKKFVPPIHFDRDRILMDLSKLEDRDRLKKGIDGELLKQSIAYIKSYEPKPLNDIQKHIEHIFNVAKDFLDRNPEVGVSIADKGNISVIFNRSFYREKMVDLLGSSEVYQKLRTSSHKGLIKKNYLLLKSLSRAGYLGEARVLQISAQETQIPMLYGVWKPFKNFSLRPVLSSVNVVGDRLFEILVDILNRLDKNNEYSLVNTTQLIDETKALLLHPEDKLFSIDVVSMFTNIQPELALSIIFPLLPSVTNLSLETFKQIFFFVTKIATEFGCLGETYKQISGLPMGTKGSPVIASIVLTHIFNQILPKHEPVTYLKKYVDDTIFITSERNAEAILSSLNNFDPRIKFTIEKESDTHSINFLDVTLIRMNQKINTRWFCKPFSSNRLVNWFSEHERHTIKNTAVRYISNMLFYSNPIYHIEILKKAEIILLKNSFPSSVIEDYIIGAKEIVAFLIFGENEADNTRFFSTLAPVKVLYIINKMCRSNVSNVKYVNTYIDHNSGSVMFSHLKDPQNVEYLNNVVIRIKCKMCKFTRYAPITVPLILYSALGLSKLFHPYNSINKHLSSSKHIGFITNVEQRCDSATMTLRYAKLICKKKNVPGYL